MPELGLHLLLIILFINFSVPPFHHLAASPSPAISMGNFNVHGEKSFNTPVSLLPVTFNPPPLRAWSSLGTAPSLKSYTPAFNTMTTHFHSSHFLLYHIQLALGLLFHISTTIFFFPTISCLQISPPFASYSTLLHHFKYPPPTLTISLLALPPHLPCQTQQRRDWAIISILS